MLDAAECYKFLPSLQSQRQSSKMSRQRSVEAEEEDTGHYHKRQKQSGSSLSTLMALPLEDIESPEARSVSVREAWLKAERLRSDPENTWAKEAAWARKIRDRVE